jgi:2,3-bisphosphoglycerate-independent phosphoglycerate mutase
MELKDLFNDEKGKIVMLVFDGLGGAPFGEKRMTELEAASIPNMDKLAKESALGLMVMTDYGIAPGSGPGHMALFGYDPLKTNVGRGVLEALGVGHTQERDELSARGNFATIDPESHVITDRRGGALTQERNKELCEKLNEKVRIEGYQVKFISGKEHRFVFILKGEGLEEELSETDPQVTGVPPPKVVALSEKAKKTADVVNRCIEGIFDALKDEYPQNAVLLRGFAKVPSIEPFGDRYNLKAAAIATYPMYKGIAKLVGMECLECGSTFEDQVKTLEANYDNFDFFFVHVKATDSYGHKGDFDGKVRVLEECDRLIPRFLALKPKVFVITGDHSTPCAVKEHSFHPVPVLIRADTAIPTGAERFTEKDCAKGILGTFPGMKLMQMCLGYAGRLKKFGA